MSTGGADLVGPDDDGDDEPEFIPPRRPILTWRVDPLLTPQDAKNPCHPASLDHQTASDSVLWLRPASSSQRQIDANQHQGSYSSITDGANNKHLNQLWLKRITQHQLSRCQHDQPPIGFVLLLKGASLVTQETSSGKKKRPYCGRSGRSGWRIQMIITDIFNWVIFLHLGNSGTLMAKVIFIGVEFFSFKREAMWTTKRLQTTKQVLYLSLLYFHHNFHLLPLFPLHVPKLYFPTVNERPFMKEPVRHDYFITILTVVISTISSNYFVNNLH
jgi:hypothetical protein